MTEKIKQAEQVASRYSRIRAGGTQIAPGSLMDVLEGCRAPSPTWEGRKEHHTRSSMWSSHRMTANNSQKEGALEMDSQAQLMQVKETEALKHRGSGVPEVSAGN